MIAKDFQHGRVWKSLFVITEECGRVDAGENRRLPGGALRPACNPEAGVGRNNYSVEDRLRLFIAKDCQRLCACETIQRVERSTGANPQAVNEEKQD